MSKKPSGHFLQNFLEVNHSLTLEQRIKYWSESVLECERRGLGQIAVGPRKLREDFNQEACQYFIEENGHLFNFICEHLESLLKTLKAEKQYSGDISPVEILDLGCGTGDLLLRLHYFSQNYKCEWKGMDFCESMRKYALSRLETVGVTDQSKIVCKPAHELLTQFGKNSQTVITAIRFLIHLTEDSEYDELAKQCYETLTPNGYLVVVEPLREMNPGRMQNTGTRYRTRIEHAEAHEHLRELPTLESSMGVFGEIQSIQIFQKVA